MSNNYRVVIEHRAVIERRFVPDDYRFPTQRRQPQPQPQTPSSFIPTTSHPRHPSPSPSYMPYNPANQQLNNGDSPMIILPPAQPYYGPIGFVDQVAEESSENEQVLEIQEQIDHANVGLSNETISKNLIRSRIILIIPKLKEEDGEVCGVCQDEYEVNQTIGTLHCGHRYHFDCIKLWLLQKNVCPICRATGLVI